MSMKNIKQVLITLICVVTAIFSVITIGRAVTTIGTNISTGGTLDVTGNVGIGTTTPVNLLEVAGTARAEKMILVHDSELSDLNADAPLAALHIRTEIGTAGIYTSWTPMDLTYPYGENLQMGEWDGTTFKERMRISGTVEGRGGFVGIGVTNPSSMLHISTTTIDSAMTITSGAGSWIMGMDFSDEGKFKIASSTVLGTNDRLTIDNNGNIGVGTTTPQTNLSVKGIMNLYPAGTGTTTCSSLIEGAIMYSTGTTGFYGCDGSAWNQLD
jgi:hypothetical protein